MRIMYLLSTSSSKVFIMYTCAYSDVYIANYDRNITQMWALGMSHLYYKTCSLTVHVQMLYRRNNLSYLTKYILFTQDKVSGNYIQVPIKMLVFHSALKVSVKVVYTRLR